MKSLGDNGFIGRSSDGGDETSRLVLMSCAAGLGAFAAGCGRNRAVQQSDTSAFGVKHIPYEMLFTANDNFIFCNLHGDSSSGKRARPPDTRCAACLRPPFTIGAQRFAGASGCTHELMTSWDTSGVSSLRRRAGLPRPVQLLLMTLSISIACAIIALQKSGLLTDITANQLSSCGLHPHSSSY